MKPSVFTTAFFALLLTTSQSQALDFGIAKDYNVFVFGDFIATDSSIDAGTEGRLAAGGQVDLSGYSIGEKLEDASADYALLAGGDINFSSGRLFHGSMLAAGSIGGVSQTVSSRMATATTLNGNAVLPIDFAQAQTNLEALSLTLSQQAVNGTYSYKSKGKNSGFTLKGDCSSPLQVFHLNGAQVQNARAFNLSCIPAEATVVFNIDGLAAQLSDISLWSLSDIAEKIVFNFYQASSLTLNDSQIEGSILAPFAAVENSQGVIRGQVIAQSWNGAMSIEHNPFSGELSGQVSETTENAEAPAAPEPATNTASNNPDNHAPNCANAVASDTRLWPANHKMATIDIDGISDADNDALSIVVQCIYQDEPLNSLGDGNTEYDAAGIGSAQAQLRSERSGTANGRVYHIDFEATDPAGESCTGRVKVGVPHSKKTTAVDDGRLYQSVPTDYSCGGGTKNHAPAIISTPLLDAVEAQNYSYQVLAEDSDGDSLTYKLSTAPDGMSINASGGLIQWIPSAEQVTSHNVTVLVVDGKGGSDSQAFSIVVAEKPNAAPIISSTPIDSASEGQAYQYSLVAHDPDNDPLSYELTQAPTGMLVDATSGLITWTPDYTQADDYPVTIVVRDDQGAEQAQSYTLTAANVNRAPQGQDQLLSTAEDTALNIRLSAVDADGDALSYELTSQPINGILTGTAPNLIYLPNNNFHGSDSFTFSASDDEAASTATIQISVSSENDQPTAAGQSVSTHEDTVIDLLLAANDSDGDALSYAIVSQPQHGTLSGTPPHVSYQPNENYNGSDQFEFIVNDGVLNSTPAQIDIRIVAQNDAPIIDSTPITTAAEGALYQYPVQASDVDGDALTFSLNQAPAGMNIDAVSGLLSWTPSFAQSGSENIAILVSDGKGGDVAQNYTLAVFNTNRSPQAQDQSVSTQEDSSIAITLIASDADGDALAYTITRQPGAGTLTGVAPNLTYTPNSNANGTDSFTFTASDNEASDSATVSITVSSTNDQPTAAGQSVTTAEDTAIAITLSGNDIDGDFLSYTVVAQPTHGTLAGTAPNLSYQPTENYNGPDQLKFVANDGTVDSAMAVVSIAVTAQNDAPQFNSTPVTSAAENTAYSYQASATDADGGSLSYSVTSSPAVQGMVIDANSGLVTWTPDYTQAGEYAVSVTVSDGQGGETTQSYTIIVINTNQPPDVPDQSVTTTEDTSVAITLAATDSDGDALSYAITSQPSAGTLTGVAPNITYIPNSNVNGLDSFTFIAGDNEGSDSASVTITVSPANDQPTAAGQNLTTDEDTAIVITLSGNDIDGDALSYIVVAQPTNGTLSGTPPHVSYQPTENFHGSDQFEFTVNDGTLDSATAVISIAVTAQNDAPQFNSTPITSAAENTAYSYQASATDADGDSLTYSLTSSPAAQGMVIDANSGLVTWTPSYTQAGSHSVVIEVADNKENVVQSYTVIVANTNRQPIIGSTPITDATEKVDYQYQVEASDPDDDSLTYLLVTAPQGMSIGSANGIVTWQPGSTDSGVHNVEISVSDSEGLTAQQSYSLTVQEAPNEAPSILSQPKTVTIEGKEYRYKLEVYDPDGDNLSIELTTAPSGIYIDPTTSSIVWPNPIKGLFQITILVVDPEGLSAEQQLELQVVDQQPPLTTMGQEYWLMFNQASGGAPKLMLYISSEIDGTVDIESPGLGYSSLHQLVANTVTTIDVTDAYTSRSYQRLGIQENAFHISADVPVSVQLINQAPHTTDASLLHPVSVAGKSYRVMTYSRKATKYSANTHILKDFIGIVATEDNTVVSISSPVGITEKNNCDLSDEYHPAGEPFQITLQRGQTYQAVACREIEDRQDIVSLSLDMTGTFVESEKPISVFGGSPTVFVGPELVCCSDVIVEQVPPLTSWGATYHTLPLATRNKGDSFRILASADNTFVTINGDVVALLNAGEFYSTEIEGAAVINASQPVLVAQFAHSYQQQGATIGLGDPFMTIVPPAGQYLSAYNVTTPVSASTDFEVNYINLITPKDSANTVRIDGQAVDVSLWVDIPDSIYVGAQLPVAKGEHHLTGDEPFGATIYGYATTESYGYLGGMALAPLTSIADMQITLDKTLPAAGEQVCISVQLFDQNQSPIPQQQVLFNRIGSNYSLDKAQLTDVTGETVFCYTGAIMGSELLLVKAHTLTATKTINWSAANSGENFPPQILSLPNMTATPAELYHYAVYAADPNQDVLDYQLAEQPEGMTIDSLTGVITWDTAKDFDAAWVTVEVSDGQLTTSQRFLLGLTPNANRYPVITTPPPASIIYANRELDHWARSYDIDYKDLFDIYSAKWGNFFYTLLGGPGQIDDRGRYLWTPTESDVGFHTVGIQVSDDGGLTDTQYFNLEVRINSAPVFSSVPDPDAIANHRYIFYSNATDAEGDFFFHRVVSGPEGLTIRNSGYNDHGLVVWIPNDSQIGEHQVTIEADDQFGGIATQSFTINVAPNHPPQFVSIPETSAIAGHQYRYYREASDPEGDSLSYVYITLPEGMAFDPYAGAFIWTPTVSQIGLNLVELQVNDNMGGADVQRFEIDVQPNHAPVISTQPVYGGKVGYQGYEYIFAANDPDGDPVSVALLSGPTGLHLSYYRDRLTWSPKEADIGSHAVELEFSDAFGGSTRQSYILTIIGGELQIVGQPSSPETMVGAQYIYDVEAIHPSDLPISFVLDQAPTGMTIDPATGVIQWTADTNQIGTHSATITVSDGLGQTDSASFNIEVTPDLTQAPDIVSLPNTKAYVDKLYLYQPEISDPQNQTISYSLEQAPEDMVINADTGLIQWIPTAEVGAPVTVVLRVSNEFGKYNEQSYGLDVVVNSAPVISGSVVSQAMVNHTYSMTLTASDEDGDELTFSTENEPVGFLVNSTSGAVSWQPTADQIGEHTVTILVTDGHVTSSYTWQITVVDEVVIGNDDDSILRVTWFSVKTEEPFVQQLESVDPNQQLTFELLSSINGLEMTAEGQLTWAATADDIGEYTAEVLVTDESDISTTVEITLRVTSPGPWNRRICR